MKKMICIVPVTTIMILIFFEQSDAQWLQTNGPGGGGINCLTVIGTRLFAGTSSGGVFQTTNDGLTWVPMNNGLPNGIPVLSFAIDSASTGPAMFAGTLAHVFRSTDYGTSWTASYSGITNPTIYSLIVTTGIAGDTNLFAGTFGGVFRSTNGGVSWTEVNSGLTNTTAYALQAIGTNLFVGTLGGGVFLSTNDGTSWAQANQGLTNQNISALAKRGTNLFAGTGSGVFLSTDSGTSWAAASSGLTGIVLALAVNGTSVFAGTDSGIFHSPNDGANWNDVSTGFPTADEVWALALSGPTLYAGAAFNGIWKRSLSEIVSDSGLVAYYPFNGNANDESGNGHNGTILGATLTTDRFGIASRAYMFNGSSYIVASSSGLPSAERTVSVWFYATFIGRPVVLGYGGGTCGTSLFIELTGCATGAYGVTSHCGANTLGHTYAQPPLLAWHHFVVVTDSSGTALYFDGVMVAENTTFINNTDTENRDLAIGVDVSPSGTAPYTDGCVGYFVGKIDDTRIYNRALTDSEIQQLYHEGGWSLGTSTVGVPLITGWNMISNPVTRAANTDSVRQLYPNSVSPHAFRFDPAMGYQQTFTMENGPGFWSNFPGPEENSITGGTRIRDTIAVMAGWNLIGSISIPALVDSIIQIPSDIVSSSYFGFSGFYAAADTLQPGKAYFVKTSQAGQLILR
jgi:hypothetical protein